MSKCQVVKKQGDNKPKKLLDQVRDVVRLKYYSIQTEQSYVSWTKRYVLFHDKKHPCEMGRSEIEAFMTHLAVDLKVSASTQNQALNGLLFLYRHVLAIDIDGSIDAIRAKRPKRLPTVMTQDDGKTPLWEWPASDGVCKTSCEGYQSSGEPYHGSRWKGRKG